MKQQDTPSVPVRSRRYLAVLSILASVLVVTTSCEPAPVPEPISTGTYTVKRGDTFAKIGAEVGVTPSRLVAANQMTLKTVIHPGNVLKLPAGRSAAFGSALAVEAQRHVGKRYVWGATGPTTFDCSGLVVYSASKAGESIPRWSAAMMKTRTQPVSKSQMRPGDLLLIHVPVSHVAIYIGNDKVVHAANSSTGVIVSPVSRYRNSSWVVGRLR